MSILSQIDHVVVLMLENRSLDNVLGWLYEEGGEQPNLVIAPPADPREPAYHGLTRGKQTLPLSYKGRVERYPIIRGTCGNGLDVPGLDPWEEYRHVTNQLFGDENKYATPTPDPPCETCPRMKGFLQDFSEPYLSDDELIVELRPILMEKLAEHMPAKAAELAADAAIDSLKELPPAVRKLSLQTWNQTLQITQTFTPEQLPVLNGLARHYAVSDMWFASVPSQTNPNRAFLHCGTSLGRESNSNLNADEHFGTNTIWNVLAESAPDCTWAIYWQDMFPPKSGKCYTDYTFPWIRKAGDHFYPLQDADGGRSFYEDIKKDGTFPAFCFLEPKWGWGVNKDFGGPDYYKQGSDYHPPTSNREGELLVRRVYEALVDSPAWERTLLVVTFDEHGGTYDHVPPPCSALSPDDHVGAHGFRFDRYGVRVPTILVSPWVERGTVFRSTDSAPYDHTSLTATILKWAGVDPAAPVGGAPKTREGAGESMPPALGRRVAVAPTFEGVLVRIEPRRGDKLSIGDPPPDPNRPLAIVNQTPSQVYAYLGWGPTEPKPYVLGWPQYIQSGRSASYDAEASLDRKLFDYYVAASYRVGDKSAIPPKLIDKTNPFDQQWRLFWEGWRLSLHHQRVVISQPEPTFAFATGTGPITIRNQTPSQIHAHLGWGPTDRKPYVLGWPKYIEPGGSATYKAPPLVPHFVSFSYWVGHPNDTPPALVDTFLGIDKSWRLRWAGWTEIGRHQILTVTQPPPEVRFDCQD